TSSVDHVPISPPPMAAILAQNAGTVTGRWREAGPLAAFGCSWQREPGDKSSRRDLEQGHSLRQAAQTVRTEASEAHTVRCRSPGRVSGIAGDENLSAVCS